MTTRPILFAVILFSFVASAQDDVFGTLDVEVVTRTDAFGQDIQIIEGMLINNDDVAYASIDIFADVLNEEGEVIGEGYGGLVNACGTGLLDVTLQPEQSQLFHLSIELFAEAEIDSVEIFPRGTAVDPPSMNKLDDIDGIEEISREEVVAVEWTDDGMLIYGAGCDADVFTRLRWHQYDRAINVSSMIAHPDAVRVTEALLQQVGLTDPLIFNRSYLTFAPTSRRIVYQTDVNTVLTAEPDGSFKRLIWDDLSRRSLHGLIWLPQGRFLAYYYGAYGDEVTYFTASVEGQRISASIHDARPSMTIPGPSPDGTRVVITTTVDEQPGYYLKQTAFNRIELLFEVDEFPGNNWPAPLLMTQEDGQSIVYVIRPVNDIPVLQCFDLETDNLSTLTGVPLDLTIDDRAWSWLSPKRDTIALAANGVAGGLWLIDLETFGSCK